MTCPVDECQDSAAHPLDECEEFRGLSVTQRRKAIKEWDRCECCLTDCRDRKMGTRCYRRIGFRRHHLLRLAAQPRANPVRNGGVGSSNLEGRSTGQAGTPPVGSPAGQRRTWPRSRDPAAEADGYMGATAPATKWHLRMNRNGNSPVYLNVELDPMRKRSTIIHEAAVRTGEPYELFYMLFARAEDGEV